jgi:hypothetical protein
MRKRKVIEGDGIRTDLKVLEVLLDIRDYLSTKPTKKVVTKKVKG